MEKSVIESMLDSLYKEMLERVHLNMWEFYDSIQSWIKNRIFERMWDAPPGSTYVTCKDLYEKYLNGLSNRELRDIYLFAKSYGVNIIQDDPWKVMLEHCTSLLPADSPDLTIAVPFDKKNPIEEFFPSSKYCYCRPSSREAYKRSLSEECEHVDLVVGSFSALDLRTRSPRNNTWYLGATKVNERNKKQTWCGKKENKELLKHQHEAILKNHNVYFIQKDDFLLQLIQPSQYAKGQGQYINMIHIDDKAGKTERSIPFNMVESFIPSDYYDNPVYYTIKERIQRAKESLSTIETTISSGKRFKTAWSMDYFSLRLHMYLDAFRKEGLLGENYQSSQQSVINAISAAVSFRLKIFKYDRIYDEEIPLATDDFGGFVSGDRNWKPGHVILNHKEKSVQYIWSFWNIIFPFPQVEIYRKGEDEGTPKIKIENQLRQRVHDNKFSKSMKRRIAEIMQRVENDRDIFPIESFPALKL